MKAKKHRFVFGVFNSGKIVYAMNNQKCDHLTAAVIVGVLDQAKDVLHEGDYFACDYYENVFPMRDRLTA